MTEEPVVPGVGYFTSVAVDGGGNPHITHMGVSEGSLRYAYGAASGWQQDIVDWSDVAGLYTSLTVTPDGQPSVAYGRQNALMYARYEADGWLVSSPDPREARFISVALDAQGSPLISYFSWDDEAIKLASWDETGWILELVDHEVLRSGGPTSLAVDNVDAPHLAYYDGETADLKYATRHDSTWVILTVDSQGAVGNHARLALDSSGFPHICYYDGTHDDLKYAHEDQYGWHVDVVQADIGWATAYSPRGLDLLIDPSDRLYVCCFFGSEESLRHGELTPSGWEWEDIESTRVVDWASLSLDPLGRPCVAYHSSSYSHPDALMFAYRVADGWHTEPIVTDGWTREFGSLSIDPFGQAYIAYYDDSLGDLMLAASSEWLGPSELPGTIISPTLRIIGVAPNPTRNIVNIRVISPGTPWNTATRVNLAAFDTGGRRVSKGSATLPGPGPHTIRWNTQAVGSGTLAPGAYLLRLTSHDHRWSETRRVVVTP